MTRTKWFTGIVVVFAAAAALCRQLPTLRDWWTQTRGAAIEKISAADFDFAAWTAADASRRESLEAGLRTEIRSWPTDDPRWTTIGERLSRAYSTMPTDGRPSTLRIAGAMVERNPATAAHCRELAVAGFADADAATRAAAVQLALHEPLRSDFELSARIEPLLLDGDPQVRRLALIAIGGNADILADDALMPLLHDGDPEVRRLCEVAFRGRGLSDAQIRLARLISDPSPAARLQVVALLRQTPGLDADVWLRRLTTDPAPAVRAAAARAAAQSSDGNLRDRLEEMTRADPNLTVREIAQFYLDQSIRRATTP